MNDTARSRILGRLRTALAEAPAAPNPDPPPLAPPEMSREEKIELLTRHMTAVRSEIHRVGADDWPETLKTLLKKRNARSLLIAPETEIGKTVAQAWEGGGDPPRLVTYSEEIETFKETLFQIDAGITGTLGGIAETGALILWPSAEEPRLLSLVPSIHVAVLSADRIYGNFAEAMDAQGWAGQMPTNALLISGPSKTADIELVLAFGVHGPKELIVLIVE